LKHKKKVRGFERVRSCAYAEKALLVPMRKTAHSAGYDLAAAEYTVIRRGETVAVPTGWKAYMQADEVLHIYIRSGLAFKKGLTLVNNVGIIDSDYYDNPDNEGHILVGLRNTGSETIYIGDGERIAQGVFTKYLLADDDRASGSRSGGIGSTGA
jgi:dUTP pyrophosphatase